MKAGMKAGVRALPRRLTGLPFGFLLALFVLSATAAAQDPAAFLRPLQAHPAVTAARAQLQAAELQLAAAYDPVALELSGGFARLTTDPVDEPEIPDGISDDLRDFLEEFFGEFGAGGLNQSWQLGATLVWRPLPVGDLADLVGQSEIRLEGARLLYREVLAGLEAQAVEAALSVGLAERGLLLAQEGAALAGAVLETTASRAQSGAASERDLREARLALQDAHSRLQDAEGELALARLALGSLTDGRLEALPALPWVTGLSPEVLRAQFDLGLARIGVAGAERNLLPVAQLAYTHYTSERDSLSLSVETRTLQPRLGYSLQDGPRGFPQSQLRSSLSVGVSLTLSDGRLRTRDAALAQLGAAEANLAGAYAGAALQESQLSHEEARAARALGLARQTLEDAAEALREALARERLGLLSPLETQAARLEQGRAELSLQAAQVDGYRRLLERLRVYAVPLSEALGVRP